MIEEDKPDPDLLLKAIQKQEEEIGIGRLKIFFGMSAGVGKTYAMLEDAQQRLKEGVDVIVATVNTHGRKETEKLLEGLPAIAEKWVEYKGRAFEEMDVESILKQKPQLVLIDELAHTNVPGSKHPKRWQDVIEILDAGIDVYTTLNVQHIESRKDIVESLTGVQVRETVPDILLERASSIELIDLPPPELLQRLKEGKVYLGEQSIIAAQNFFQEVNLTALREIALRFTAEKVDHDLHGILDGKRWNTRERLMVAISPSPASEQLIRSARRLAFELDAPWIAVYVNSGGILNDADQQRLNRHFNLSRELGAEVVTSEDVDVPSALQRIAKQKDITRIMIGRPPKRKRSILNFFEKSFLERVEEENKQVDIVIQRQEKLFDIYQRSVLMQPVKITRSLNAYALAFALILGLTLIGKIISPVIGFKSIGYIFLMGILILSSFVSQGPIFFAAALSTLSWDFLFIPPLFGTGINDLENVSLVILYFFVALIVGILTSRLRQQDQMLHKREEKMERLYEIEKDIANAANFQYLRVNVNAHLESIFPGNFDILIKGDSNQLIFDSKLAPLAKEKEKTAAVWTFQNGKIGGWSTDTLPSSEAIYFPIKYSKSTLGVLAFHPKGERTLSIDEMNFIQTVAQQLGIYLERYIFEERISKQDYSRQIERMHQAIFHSLNRSFYSPLEGISSINHQLQQGHLDPQIRSLVSKMEQFITNLKLTVDNIIAISEIESGFVPFERKRHSLKEIIDASLEEVKPFLSGRAVKTKLPSQPDFFPFDIKLLKLALKNLIFNAIEYSPPAHPLSIEAQIFENEFRISVIDQGPGISDEIIPLIFEKFYQIPGTDSTGLGLGLAIVKSVVEIHQGKIEVINRKEGGTEFSLIIPIEKDKIGET